MPLLLFVYGPTTVVVLTPVLSNVHQVVVGEWWRISIGGCSSRSYSRRWVRWWSASRSYASQTRSTSGWGGFFVVVLALPLLRDVELPAAGSRWGPVVGWASGALSTSTPPLASPPVVLLLASCGLLKRTFRGSSAL